MTTSVNPTVGAPLASSYNWQSINWKAMEETVNKLQMRIAKAIRLGLYNKVKALQWILTNSFAAKLLAVKRVTQNKGKRTPGIDHVIWKSSEEKMQASLNLKRKGYRASPLRRIYIPKKNGKLRPLGIPTMIDRAQQALHLLSLEPIAEILADKNSYGFRPKRSLHDAIEQCFIALARKTSGKWILEGDIKACFDEISHEWLEKHVIMDKKILKEWLKAGFMEKDVFHQTTFGTPQGGLASPCLANLTLDGLEKAVLSVGKRKNQLNFVRYADDWICTASTKEILEEKVLPIVINFLKERGLELSPEKTKITHIDEGFDFLGCNLRKYGGKLLIKPGKKSIKAFLTDIREVIFAYRNNKAEILIEILNPKIQGWANHYRHIISKKIFHDIDSHIWKSIWKWARRRHPNKTVSWIKDKYFTRIGQRDWIFFVKRKSKINEENLLTLKFASAISIKRHVKIQAEATPYNPKYKEYFKQRDSRHQKKQANRRTTNKGL